MTQTPVTADETVASRQKQLEDWLPITGSRKAKWWYSAFHNLTAMVGAGVLSLPYAMSRMGWGAGVTVLTLSWLITLFTLWQMVNMHEMVPGKRFDRYHELGQHAFGEKLGLYIVVPQQVLVQVGTCIAYMVTGGHSMRKVHDTICNDCSTFRSSWWIVIFAAINFVLCHFPNFNSMSAISFLAAVMSISYSVIAWVASVSRGVQPDVSYSIKSHSTADATFNFFTSMGDIAFAFAGHSVALEIQATIPSTPEKPSTGPMWRGVIWAYIGVAFCYFPVAILGYYIFGNSVADNVLVGLEHPRWLVAAANIFVVVHVVGGYQVFAMAVFDMLETFLVVKLKFPPSNLLRFITRTVYVVATMLVAIAIPFFSALLGFLGGFAFAPTSYFLPCIMWLRVYKPKRFSLSWIVNWTCITLGLILMMLSPIGALRNIILSAKDYKFFS